MAVRADHAVARAHEPLFGQQRVFDAHRPHVEEVLHSLVQGKCARALDLARRLDIFIGRKVVHDKGDLVLIFDVSARLLHLFDGNGRGDVVSQGKIELRFDELPRRDIGQPRMCGKDLLRHCHPHDLRSFFRIFLDKV